MFTGIVEAVGNVVELMPTAGGYRIRIETGLAPELKPGDSLAVNGVCLTCISTDEGEVRADIGPETARVTTFAALQRGQSVNLERSVRADARLDGHVVQGHVDGVGMIHEVRPADDCHWLTIGFPSALAPYFIRKGSVAIDGVSLTIAGLDQRQFDVQIVPFTWSHTAFERSKAGDKVNIEGDMIGKYVARAMEVARQRATRRR